LFKPIQNNKTFFYLKNIKNTIFINHSYLLILLLKSSNFIKNTKKCKFFILKKKFTFLTITKAPMAHKKWSREQYSFKYYLFIISFKSKNIINLHVSNYKYLFFFLNFFYSWNYSVETNLFFLKYKLFNFYINSKNLLLLK
jgi:hypothetical protein